MTKGADIPTLLKRLALAEPEARAAQEQLYAHGVAAVDPLLAHAKAIDSAAVQRRTVTVLGWIGTPEVRRELLTLAAPGSLHSDTRAIAVRASLDEASQADARASVDQLRALARDPDYFVRAAACAGLGLAADEASVTVLRQLAGSDPEPFVRQAASQALALAAPASAPASGSGSATASAPGSGSAPAPAPAPASAAPDARPDPVQSLRHARDAIGRERALQSILALGDRAGAALTLLLDDPRAVVRITAMRGLLQVRDPGQKERLRHAVEHDANADVRGLAAAAMAAVVDDEDADEYGELFLRWTHDRDGWVRAAATSCVAGACDDARSGKRLSELLADREDRVALAAAEGVVRFAARHDMDGWPTAVRRAIGTLAQRGADGAPEEMVVALFGVVRALAGKEEASLAAHAARIFLRLGGAVRAAALGVLVAAAERGDGDPEIAATFLSVLDEPDSGGSHLAVLRALSRTGVVLGSAGIRRVAQLARTDDGAIALAAVQALAQVGTFRAAQVLVDLAGLDTASRHSIVAGAARDALDSWADGGAVRVRVEPPGLFVVERIMRCARDGRELSTVSIGDAEQLRCPECDTEHALGARERAVPVEDAPFGVCWCDGCSRKRLLIRGSAGLRCPASGERYVVDDSPGPDEEDGEEGSSPRPGGLLRVVELPFGVCGCCDVPRPLTENRDAARSDEDPPGPLVICSRTRKRHVQDPSGRYTPRVAAAAMDASAIDRALLAGGLRVGRSGLASPVDEDEEL